MRRDKDVANESRWDTDITQNASIVGQGTWVADEASMAEWDRWVANKESMSSRVGFFTNMRRVSRGRAEESVSRQDE